MLQMTPTQTVYLKNGSRRYVVEVTHAGLNKHQLIKGEFREVVEQKARLKALQWAERWERLQEKENKRRARQAALDRREGRKLEAIERTAEATEALAALENLLLDTLEIDDTVDWLELEDHSSFTKQRPAEPGAIGGAEVLNEPLAPSADSPAFRPELGLLDKIIPSRADRKRSAMVAKYARATEAWESEVRRVRSENEERAAVFRASLAEWESERDDWERDRQARNAAVRREKDLYLRGMPDAIEEYCDRVLNRSRYPDIISLEHELQYIPETRTLIVESRLPAPDDLPTLREVKYVASKDEFVEKHLSEAHRKRQYDSVLYQICLRTLHEIFEADAVDAIAAVVMNGSVTSIDPATGNSVTACVLSIQVSESEFEGVNLAAVDPKACFRALRGVGSSKLHSLAPVAPVMQFRREDGRFVSAREVVGTLDDGVNLAAMDWEDFEHLIRELFEQEFKASGGEVSVTQASRDGGVDAIAYDPDPIRGGKIVIQAKRYTNTVGVAAVRDLYGTVMNEGATKGILVTTSDYGPDAYSFSKDKPLTLLSGSNLLHLLEKHGHRARIDIQAARALASE